MRSLAILGATGSIGTQAVEVALRHADRFRVVALTAHTNAEALFALARKVRPLFCGLAEPPQAIPEDLKGMEWGFGPEGLRQAATLAEADDVLVSVVGFAGLPAVLNALSAKKRVLLANKEALVAGGALVMAAAARAGQVLLPVDSEHSAVFQCLRAAEGNAPTRLILTASGGPFRDLPPEAIARATVAEALRHPTWSMGRKITVDSATMLNKALEVIEARWLFGMPPESIDVLIHRESVVHSMVAFRDGAVLAQLGMPDMRLPILYAMSFPERLETGGARLDLARVGRLTFETPDAARFPGLALGYRALRAGGTAPAILNAANETAVEAFLAGAIPFGGIARAVEETLSRVPAAPAETPEAIGEADAAARRVCREHGLYR